MFTPKWKKEAQEFYKAGKKFVHFKRDLLKPDRVDEIKARLRDLKTAMKGPNAKENAQEAIRQLDSTCENALPRQAKKNPLGDQIESLFVTLVIVLGLRSYYTQPYVIPTGSMQPTLNGVICSAVDKDEWANPIVRVGEKVLRGRAHVYKKAPVDLIVPSTSIGFVEQNPGSFKLLQTFHRVARLNFENKSIMAHGLPASSFAQQGAFSLQTLISNHGVRKNGRIVIPKGTVLYSGTADSGDVIWADKMSYHFRKPRRGEVFIFDTRGINTSQGSASLSDQQSATHYIKRCVGVPGDTLSIEPPNLLVDGEIATEKYMRRVMERQGPYAETQGYIPGYGPGGDYLGRVGQQFSLKDNSRKPWKAEYAAMGDNTENSLDSRYWGSVKEFNIVAPARFTLWPITTGHWGFIK